MTNSKKERLSAQEELELSMKADGEKKFMDLLRRAGMKGDLSNNKGFREGLSFGASRLVKEIDAWLKAARRGTGGKRLALTKNIDTVPAGTLAFLTCKYAFNGVMLGHSLTTMQRELGGAVLDEVRLGTFYAQNKDAYKWVEREIKARKVNTRHFKRAFFYKVAQHKNIELPVWREALRVQVGAALIELLTRTELAQYSIYKSKGKTKKELWINECVYREIRKANGSVINMASVRQPMIEPPKPWESLGDGGYKTMRFPLVIGMRDDHKVALGKADLSKVHEAMNALDAVPFKVNTKVLDIVRWAYEKNLTIGKLPPSQDDPMPDKPKGMPDKTAGKAKMDAWKAKPSNKEKFTSWKKRCRATHERNSGYQGARFAVSAVIATAEKHSKYPKLYFPNQLDFRGRVYSLPIMYQPQGPDYSRALMTFAEGKPIGEDMLACGWLMIHGANCWGYDKVSLEDRIKWVEDHLDHIRASYDNPKGHLWWTKAEKPFAFLAWVFDFIDVLDHGKPSYVRVAMDGSCNGIQHFAAMLRDPIAAKAVNLAKNDKPQDIYQMVADVVIGKLKAVTGADKWMAETWLQLDIDRKLCKRSVMVMPYGGKMSSTLSYVEEEFRARLAKNKQQDPFGDKTGKACVMLGKMVYEATREVVKGGAVMMTWLQSVAKVASAHNVHLQWELPHGFVAKQSYVKYQKKRVKTRLDGGTEIRDTEIISILYDPTDAIDKQRSQNSISPNFVHSLDACALMTTVLKAKAAGIATFHMVHDDYGTHAADTQKLSELLREAFVELYRDHDILGDFREQVLALLPKGTDLPPAPKVGTFDIEEVVESDFFFA